MKFGLLFLLALVLPVASPAAGLGVRLSGGWGFSLNSQSAVDPSFNTVAIPESAGLPLGAELVCGLGDGLEASLGIFPVFASASQSVLAFNNSFALVPTNQTTSATYLPVLLNLYVSRPLAPAVSWVAGAGAGILPASRLLTHYDQPNFTDLTVDLNSALALRCYLGLEAALGTHTSVGAGVQYIAFDPTILGSQSTQDFNQLAPMLNLQFSY